MIEELFATMRLLTFGKSHTRPARAYPLTHFIVVSRRLGKIIA